MVNQKRNFFTFCLTERILIERKINWALSLFGNVNLEDENGEFLRHLSSKLFVKIKILSETLEKVNSLPPLTEKQLKSIRLYIKFLNLGLHGKKRTYFGDNLFARKIDTLETKNNIFKLCDQFLESIQKAINTKNEKKYQMLTNRRDFNKLFF